MITKDEIEEALSEAGWALVPSEAATDETAKKHRHILEMIARYAEDLAIRINADKE